MIDQTTINYIENLESEVRNRRNNEKNLQDGLSNAKAQTSMYGSEAQTNLVQWQLDLREELERIDHLLRGHVLKFDSNGSQIYVEPQSEDMKPLNDYGVQMIMNVVSFYLNRNTILSNYDEDTINWKVFDFGNEINDLIFMKYEEMGMNTPTKKKMYAMIVRELVDTVHSAYLRALNGGERESLRKSMYVTQNEPLGGQGYNMPQTNNNTFSLFKPSTWKRI